MRRCPPPQGSYLWRILVSVFTESRIKCIPRAFCFLCAHPRTLLLTPQLLGFCSLNNLWDWSWTIVLWSLNERLFCHRFPYDIGCLRCLVGGGRLRGCLSFSNFRLYDRCI